MPPGVYEQARREPRTPTSGGLLIEVSPDGKIVHGDLLDVSPHGFAIRHEHPDFVAGQQVRVVYEWGKVSARLVWVGRKGGVLAAGFRTD